MKPKKKIKNMTKPMPPEMAMPAEQAPEPTSQGGEVSMSIPKTDFDNMYDLIMQLASVLENMKSTVDTQEMAAQEGMETTPEEIAPSDAADLEMFAKELNTRSV
jgi:hypothetical protein